MAVITLTSSTGANASCPQLPDGAVTVTPSDTNTFSQAVTIFVGVGGAVTYTPANGGADVVWQAVAGQPLPSRAVAVKATGTTGSGMLAVY